MILLIGDLVATIISALGVIIVARLLTAASYGVVSIAFIPSQMAKLFIDLGINQALIRNISALRHQKKFSEVRTYIETGVLFKTILSLFLSLIVFGSAEYIATQVYNQIELVPLIKITSLGILGQTLFDTSVSIFVGYEKMLHRSYLFILFSFLKSITGPLLVFLGYGPAGAIYGRIFPVLIVGTLGVFLSFLFIRRMKLNESRGHLDALRSMLIYGAPLFLSNLLINGRARILNSILPLYSSNEIIGNLSATLNFSVLVTFISNPIATALFPLLSKFSYEEGKEIQRIFRTAIKYTTLLVYPITTIVILLSTQIVSILFDTGYRYAPFYIQLFMVTNYYAGFGHVGLNKLLNSQEKTRITLNIKIIQFMVGLSIGLLFIPRMGAIGFLLTKALSPIPGLFYGLNWVKNNFEFTIDFKTSFKILGICLGSFIICSLFLSLTYFGDLIELILGTILFLVIYGILIIKINVIRRRDLESIIELLRIEWVSSLVFWFYDFVV